MIKISLDLELEQGNDGVQVTDSAVSSPEIIQVGLCVFNATNGDILHTACLDIYKPYRLSSYIQKLTGIRPEDLNNSILTIKDAYNYLVKIREQYQASRNIIQWGGGDLEELLREVQPAESSFGSPVNLKHIYSAIMEAKGVNSRGGLAKSLGRLGMSFKPWQNKGKHNAAADAYNTALLYVKVTDLMRSINLDRSI